MGGREAPEPYDVRWFTNRWPALASGPAVDVIGARANGTTVVPAVGASEVVLFSSEHRASLATLPREQVRKVVDVWAERTTALLARGQVEYALVFENRTEVGDDRPPARPDLRLSLRATDTGEGSLSEPRRRLRGLCQIRAELDAARIVLESEHWVAYVPFASAYPYGMRLAPLAHVPSLPDLGDGARDDLAALLGDVLGRYDRLWPTPSADYLFPYLLWFHQAPASGGDEWHVHAHTAPPLRAPGAALRRVGRARKRHARESGRPRRGGA